MEKAELIQRFSQNNDDKLFIAHVLDKEAVALYKNIPAEGDFLDVRRQAILLSMAPHLAVKPILWGGYEDAERKMFFFLPDYMEEAPTDSLCVIKATHRDTKAPSHRDYLGSILGLGVKREGVGDILVSEDSAQIIVRASLSDFFLSNYISAGRVHLSVSSIPVSELIIPESEPVFKSASLASLRADAVLAAAFNVSRTVSQEAIMSGKVHLNNLPLLKGDKLIAAGDKIRWQGKGRFILSETGGQSRKGRLFVTFRF